MRNKTFNKIDVAVRSIIEEKPLVTALVVVVEKLKNNEEEIDMMVSELTRSSEDMLLIAVGMMQNDDLRVIFMSAISAVLEDKLQDRSINDLLKNINKN